MEVIKLNLIPTGALPVVHASQYDDGRTFRADLYDGAEVYHLDGTETISCELKKPDGNIVTLAVTNTSESFIEIQTTEQACAVAGESLAEVKIEKGADKIGSLNFILSVERSPIEGGIESETEINNLWTQVDGMVADILADSYDSASVIFDDAPTAGHGIPYTVTSEGIGEAIDAALDMSEEVRGYIASFETPVAMPLIDCKAFINCAQAEGTPTPDNPLSITGHTGLKLGYVDWNQNDYAFGNNRSTLSNYVNSENDITVTAVATTQKTFGFVFRKDLNTAYQFIKDHVYFYSVNITDTNISNFTRYSYTGTMGPITQYYYGTSGAHETIGKPTSNGAQSFNGATANASAAITDNFTFNSVQVIDLTKLFGEKIAQMIYDLEYNSVGEGVALFKSIFNKSFYSYDAGGTMVTVESVNGETYPNASVSWNDEAGTIYGGNLDLTTGVLTVDYYAVDMGLLTYDQNDADSISVSKDSINAATGENPARSITAPYYCEVFDCSDGAVFVNSVNDLTFTTTVLATDAATTFNGNLLIYPLATPLVYNLTPVEVDSIVGDNSLFHDCNGETAVKYISERGGQTEIIAETVGRDLINNGAFADLDTTDKTIVGAINETLALADSCSQDLETVTRCAVYSFSKTIAATTQATYYVTRTDLALPAGAKVVSAFLRENTANAVNAGGLEYSAAVYESATNAVEGAIYNGTATSRTYSITATVFFTM